MKDNKIKDYVGKRLKSNLPYLQGKTFMIDDVLHILEYADYNGRLQGVYVNEDNEDNNFMGKKSYKSVLESLYE